MILAAGNKTQMTSKYLLAVSLPMHACFDFILKHGHFELLPTLLIPKAGLICSSVVIRFKLLSKQNKTKKQNNYRSTNIFSQAESSACFPYIEVIWVTPKYIYHLNLSIKFKGLCGNAPERCQMTSLLNIIIL